MGYISNFYPILLILNLVLSGSCSGSRPESSWSTFSVRWFEITCETLARLEAVQLARLLGRLFKLKEPSPLLYEVFDSNALLPVGFVSSRHLRYSYWLLPRTFKSSCGHRWRNRHTWTPSLRTQNLLDSQLVIDLNLVSTQDVLAHRVKTTKTILLLNGPSASPNLPLLNADRFQSG